MGTYFKFHCFNRPRGAVEQPPFWYFLFCLFTTDSDDNLARELWILIGHQLYDRESYKGYSSTEEKDKILRRFI